MLPILTINGSVATIGGKWLGGESVNQFNPYGLPPRTVRFEMPTGWSWSDPASSWAFHECGYNSEAGSAELAQIPSSWK